MSRKDNKGKVLLKGESQRKDGIYIYRWKNFLGVDKVISSKDLNTLRKKEKEVSAKEALGISNENITLNKQIEKWLYTKQDIKLSSRRLYEGNYESFIKSSKLGNTPVSDIKKTDVLIFLKKLEEDFGLKTSTIGTILPIIKQSLELACDDNVIAKNPASNIKLAKRKSTSDKIALTSKQEAELMERIELNKKNKDIKPLVGIILNIGIRIAEAVGLTWDNIDFDKGTVYIEKQMRLVKKENDNKSTLTMYNPKSESGQRLIYMTPQVKQYFILQREIYQKRNKGIVVEGHSDFVFLTNRGTPLSIRSLELTLAYLSDDMNEKREVQLPHISPHILRHTACTKMLMSGMNIKAVQYIMGHNKPDITLDTYTHLSQEELRAEILKME
jgi:integrase